jgi:predicted transcriptional regulator
MTNKDYYPDATTRLQTINEQMDEIQKIIFRNDLEARIAEETDDSAKKARAEADYNNGVLIKKLEVLYAVKKETEDELGIG